MYVCGICPTFRQPELLANLLACWQRQTYPVDKRRLIILDDAGTFDDGQGGDDWKLYSVPLSQRLPSLPAKYNRLLELMPDKTDAVLIMETDDIYLPRYVESHVGALWYTQPNELSKAPFVMSDYTDPTHIKPIEEPSDGRFHPSMGFRTELIRRIGGWPDTKRADFDQQLIGKLTAAAHGVGWPWATGRESQYICRWHSGAAHGQSTMRAPDDTTWYDRALYSYRPVPYIGKLVPMIDTATAAYFRVLGVE